MEMAFQVNEEVRELGKKLKQIEADLVKNKEDLEQANKNLEEKEKLLTTVSFFTNFSKPCRTPAR